MLFQPRGAQIEALYALKNSRREGADKGLVYAATGVGKTYLAAFDSAGFEKVLFVAHREEILRQAAKSFQNVRHSQDYGFFTGKEKTVVIDEFHHAVRSSISGLWHILSQNFCLD